MLPIDTGRVRLRQGANWRLLALLFAIVLTSVVVRLERLPDAGAPVGTVWQDPDGYLRQAAVLTRDGTWRWTADATHYRWNDTSWTLPPAYPVFLSLWYRQPDLNPRSAAVAQVILSGLTPLAMYWLVVALHAPRAALLAAALQAFSFAGFTSTTFFIQESLFVPLLTSALAALAVCLVANARPLWFAGAGLVLALAALTRATPLYFLPVLLVLMNVGAGMPRPSVRHQAAYFGAIAVVLLPYIASISAERGRLVLIDDHGAIVQMQETPAGVPTVVETTRVLVARAWTDLPERLEMARGMLQVYGRSWLFHYGAAADAAGARRLEWTVRIWLDAVFVLLVVAAPWGLALARSRRVGLLLAGWAVFTVAISVAAGFSGARYRAPLEIVLIAGASAALLPGGNRPTRTGALVAGLACLGMAAVTAPQVPASWAGRSPYGIEPEAVPRFADRTALAASNAGFFVTSDSRVLSFAIELPPGQADVSFRVAVDGSHIRTVVASAGRPADVRLPVSADGAYYIELAPEAGGLAPGDVYRIRFTRL